MKLGTLKTTIREMKTNPLIRFALHPQSGPVEVEVALQKGPLLVQLDLAFTEGRAQETGLCISPEGFLTAEETADQA